ncbi:AI-2E family transporter [Roseimaritima ulvae]|uniref:Putative inner membrane protein n=1 Tax=Roseimaritima ulvae TaxID=980254 RepID=A0A5B9QT17_9BACT|nr:AI-2E family transporter [Roseimaritima ulvae]QEG40555.1 putative inner membrane protein [Roseimaritima ulvae]
MSDPHESVPPTADAPSESAANTLLGSSISRLISVAVLIVVIVAIGILFYRVMVGFFVPLFLAALLVVIFRPLHTWFCERSGQRPRLAAMLTTGTILLIVLIPAALVLTIGAAQGTRLLSGVNSQNITLAIGRARDTFGLSMQAPEVHRQLNVMIDQLADKQDLPTIQARLAEVEQLSEKLRDTYKDTPQFTAELFEQLDELLQRLRAQAIEMDAPTANVERADVAPANAVLELIGEPMLEQDSGGPPATSDWQRWQDYQQTLVEIDDTNGRLQNQMLGGAIRAELKLLANPSDEAIHIGLVRGRQYLQGQLPSVASATTGFLFHIVFGLVVLVIAIYFFLLDGPTMTRTMMRLSPLDDAYEERLLVEFDRTSRAVVLATILSALTQGVLAAFGYYVAGLDSVVLLFLATTFMALIPFLGAMSVWLPCVLWLGFVDQRWGAAIGLAIWGALVVSTIDNVIKVFILHGHSQLHPLLALLSVLGGVQVFGPVGILVGPMIVVFLQTLLEILHHELMKDREPETAV